MVQIALAEGHEETDPPRFRDRLGQALDFLMVQQIHIFFADLIKIVFALDAHGRHFHPVPVFPVTPRCGNFAEVDFRIEIRCKRVTMVAAVAVEDIDRVDRIELMLFGIGAVSLGHAGIEAAAEECHDACILESLSVSPLPAVIEISGESGLTAAFFIDGAPLRIIRILRFVVGGIHIIDAAGQAGIHQRQILVRESYIHDKIRLFSPDQSDDLVDIVRIDLGRRDLRSCLSLQFGRQFITFRPGPAGQAQFRKHFAGLAALLDGDGSNAAAADD